MNIEISMMELASFVDRRHSGPGNKARRFLNNFWVIPVILIYFQLYSVLFVANDPVKGLVEANQRIAYGATIVKKLIVTDFPYAIKGHLQELVYMAGYHSGQQGVSSGELEKLIRSKKEVIYNMIINSQSTTYTEVGGAVILNDDEVKIIPVGSINGKLSREMHSSNLTGFTALLDMEQNRNIVKKIDISSKIIYDTLAKLNNSLIPVSIKEGIKKNFIRLYDSMSEYNYLLTPEDFKSFLGRSSGFGEYAGFYHIHNGYFEVPSDVDVGRSFDERQIVFTLSTHGFIVYDIMMGEMNTIKIDVDTKSA